MSSPASAAKLHFEEGKPLATGDLNENPDDIGLMQLLAEDYRTHGSTPRAAGFWALAVHRLGNARMAVRSPTLRAPLSIAYRTAHKVVIAAFGIDLPYNAKIGRRFHLGHHGCVHLGARVVGNDVYIHHSVTIGLAKRSERGSAPVIGDRVEIGAGACIVGDIEIGDDCFIGANSVVADTLPPGTAVLGVPARVIDVTKVAAPESLRD